MAALIEHYAGSFAVARLFVACGSMGGCICWKLAANDCLPARLSGLMLLGSVCDEDFLERRPSNGKSRYSSAMAAATQSFAVDKLQAFFRSIAAPTRGYPPRFVRFENGTHGTPIRMVNWRETLNWMMSVEQ